MSLVLEGNARELRFGAETGPEPEVDPSPTPEPLGRPRVRRPKRPKVSENAADMRYSPWPGGAWMVSTHEVERRLGRKLATPNAAPVPEAAASTAEKADVAPSIARKLGELADRFPHSLRRIAPAAAPPPAQDQAPAAIPFFRSAEQIRPEALAVPVLPALRVADRRPSLGVWIVASIIVGLLSYQVASHVITRVQAPAVTAAR